MTSPRTSPAPASAPRAGAGGGAAPDERADLAALEAEYLRLCAAIVVYAGVADPETEARLRNRAMAVLLRLAALRRPRGGTA